MASAVLALLFTSGLTACHDLTGTQPLPAGTQDPSYYNNASGAMGMRNEAISEFDIMMPHYISVSGLLADELTDSSTVFNTVGIGTQYGGVVTNPVDERILPELSFGANGAYSSDKVYNKLQGIRTALLQAMGQFAVADTSAKDTAVFNPSVGRALRGELHALYGYTEILLADLFCSGIPLSTIDFQKDYTYRAGDSTAQVYRDAIAHFDTALALSADSIRIQNLARIGLGRAHLNLGEWAAAADDVSGVATTYAYQLTVPWGFRGWNGSQLCSTNAFFCFGVVADTEGHNGMAYVSSSDPRTVDTLVKVRYSWGFDNGFFLAGYPKLYTAALQTSPYTPMILASGVEARLIEAEAALRSGGDWLGRLNDLRATAPIAGTNQPAPTELPALNDPGSDSARVALLFHERAAWLYMTGHRQGDLRRQLREYSQYWPDQSMVYPSGRYAGIGLDTYGVDVNAPIPQSEYLNPLFHGCLNRAP
jgi:hypothetical protein